MKSCRNLPAVLAVLFLAACAGSPAQPPPETPAPPGSASAPAPAPSTAALIPAASGLQQIADEGTVTYSKTLNPGQCHARDGGHLPDPACTPGSTDPAVTQATIRTTICVRGWTATIRPPASETTALKHGTAYPAYGIPQGTVSELDHLVPLELGGSNDVTNLWPEAGAIPNAKDPAENDLTADVCAGELTLTAAQAAIAADWETVP
jgi:hypothetical protein